MLCCRGRPRGMYCDGPPNHLDLPISSSPEQNVDSISNRARIGTRGEHVHENACISRAMLIRRDPGLLQDTCVARERRVVECWLTDRDDTRPQRPSRLTLWSPAPKVNRRETKARVTRIMRPGIAIADRSISDPLAVGR